jgi:hypothetical protein
MAKQKTFKVTPLLDEKGKGVSGWTYGLVKIRNPLFHNWEYQISEIHYKKGRFMGYTKCFMFGNTPEEPLEILGKMRTDILKYGVINAETDEDYLKKIAEEEMKSNLL